MRVVIIGGGFAGRAAAKNLFNKLAFEKSVEIVLIDKNSYSTMLPSLPDVAGNKIRPKYVKEEIERIVPKGIKFIQKIVQKVDFTTKTVYLDKNEKIIYDYLIFSPGSKANFYNYCEEFQKNYTLDSLDSALLIRDEFYRALTKDEITDVIISGGSFTGIELACNLLEFTVACNKKVNVTIVEKTDRLLPMLSEEIAIYAKEKLDELDINMLFSEEVEDVQGKKVTLKSGKVIDNAFFCWCGGVKNAVEAIGNHKVLDDCRIIVDEYLRIPEHPEVFIAGDAAAVKMGNDYIRRAVNFSTTEGTCVGKNVAACLNGDKLQVYKPIDKGWVIPINNTGVGKALSFNVKGRKGILMHYLMCGITNYNGRNLRKFIKLGFEYSFRKE